MNTILKKIKEYDKEYIIELYSSNTMEDFELDKVKELNKLQQYELRLNQEFLNLNNYEELKETIFSNNWKNLNHFNLTNSEILNYFEEKSVKDVSIDRAYFFNEIKLYFCEQSKKREYVTLTLDSLKLSINKKLKDKNDYDLLISLSMRFILMSCIYNINQKEYVEEIICKKLLNEYDINNDFSTLVYFYKFIFKEYNKKMHYPILLKQLNLFSEQSKITILNKPYEIGYYYASLIAEIYKLKNIANKNKEITFYKKEIDNVLIKINDVSISEAFKLQIILYKILRISKDIKYKTKEVQSLVKENADLIKNNSDKLFNQTNYNDDIKKTLEECYKILEDNFLKISNIDEKIDYLIFYEIYNSFSSHEYKKFKENQKHTDYYFYKAFFPSASRVSHQGMSYTIKDNDLFEFFNVNVVFFNNLLLHLDYEYKWVVISNKVLFNQIENIQILTGYLEQYKTALLLFEEEKYIEFMYISPGLVENLLKQFLYQINGEVFSSRGEPMEKTLNQILEELIVDENCYIDKCFLHYINYILVDKTGLNLRNNILHGNYQDGYFNKDNSMYLYVVLVFLMRYFRYDQD